MKRSVNRRRFVGLLGASGIVGSAGCLGGDDGGNPGENSEPDTSENGNETEDQSVDPDQFDFPPGADDSGIVPDRVLSGVRDILATTERYQVSQSYQLDHGNGAVTAAEETIDVQGETAYEQQISEGTRIERLVTPEETRCRATEVEGDRSGQWVVNPVDPDTLGARSFHLYAFEQTTVPELLGNGSLEFEEIVTENDQRYARYTGTSVQREWASHQWWDSARMDHQVETPLEGTVSLLLAESGAVHAVEYEIAGSVARQSLQGREVTDAVARGEIQFAYDGLEAVATPDWASGDGFREFGIEDRNNTRVYELTQGPALPGSVNLSYAEFYVCAHLDGEQYIAKFAKTQDFEVGDPLFMALGDDGLEVNRFSLDGTNPLTEADWIEVSVYLFHPEKERSLIYHDEFQP
jgi:hypothetical protein